MDSGTRISVEVKGRPKDRRALASAFRTSRPWWRRLPLLAAAIVFSAMVVFGRDAFARIWALSPGEAATFSAFAGFALFFITLNLFAPLGRRSMEDPRGTFSKGYRVSLDNEGVHITGENLEAHHRWPGILRLQETEKHFFVYTDGAQAIIVPKRSFGSPEEVQLFADFVHPRMAVTNTDGGSHV